MEDLRQLIVKAASLEAPEFKTAEPLASAEDAPQQGPTADPADPSVDLDDYKQQYEIGTLQQALIEAAQTHQARIDYIGKIYWLVVGWLACVVACVAFSGFAFHGFSLSEKVLIAFITSTTINVLGLFVVVAKWLYPSPHAAAGQSAPKKRATKRKKA